jgi:hypothetical protein
MGVTVRFDARARPRDHDRVRAVTAGELIG